MISVTNFVIFIAYFTLILAAGAIFFLGLAEIIEHWKD